MNSKEKPVFVKPVQRSRISDQVVVQLTNLILDGVYGAGDKLPPERELARQFSINRNSLREALRRMEDMGLIQIRPGDGIFVQDYNMTSGLEFLKFLLANGIGLDLDLIMALAEVRRIFAGVIFELAVERMDEGSLSALQKIVDNYPREATPDRETGRPDFEFFREIIKATNNKVFAYMFNTIQDVFERMSGLYYQVEGSPETAADLYGNIVKAFRDRDAGRAIALISEQMKRDDEMLEKMLEGDR